MNKIIIILFVWLAGICVFAQPSQVITPINETAQMLFDISENDFSYNENNYRLYIAQPKEGGDVKRPVLYMLDGNGQFPMLLNMISELSVNIPLIVGIGYPTDAAYPQERTRDYTVPLADKSDGGGAEEFSCFIREIIKPFIENNFNIDKDRQTLAGHSHAGQFVLYEAFNHPETFNNFVSGSASLWWGDGAVIPKQLPLFKHAPGSLTITLGEYEEDPDNDPRLKTASPEIKKMRERRRSSISHKELALMISQEVKNCRYIVFEEKNHGSSIPEYLIESIRVSSTQ